MRRIALVASCLVATASCVQDQGTVYIEGVLVTPPGSCVVNATDKDFLAAGLLDIGPAAPGSYTAPLKVITNLPATTSSGDIGQDQGRSPNYPDYGASDNNVIIFDQARVDIEYTDVDTVTPVASNLKCDKKECKLEGLETTVGGSVFNVQTSLSQPSVVFTELVTASDAALLRTELASALQRPDQRRRIIVTARVHGRTTGNGEVTTFPFPFPIDLCNGCLVADSTTCTDDLNGTVVAAESCLFGQDAASQQCVCDDDTIAPATGCAG